VWHFSGGDPIRLILLHPKEGVDEVRLGANVTAGQRVQLVIPAGVWQAGELCADGTYGLFGCTMAPGFSGAGLEGGLRSDLLRSHPSARSDIERLALPDDESPLMSGDFAT